MKSRARSYSSRALVTEVSLNPYNPGVWTWSDTSRVSLVDSLSVVTDVTGNKVTPNPQLYYKYWFEGAAGILIDVDESPIGYRRSTEGVLLDAGSYLTQLPIDKDEVYNRALSSLNDSIRGDTDLSIDAMQWRKTVQMFRAVDKLVALARVANLNGRKRHKRYHMYQWRKARRSGYSGSYNDYLKSSSSRDSEGTFKDLSSFIGSAWLELQYGWKPLMSSIYGSLEGMVDHALKTEFTREFKGRGQIKVVSPKVVSGDAWTTWTEATFRCEIGVVLGPVSTPAQSVQNYTSLNPVSIFWEWLPYSFVVDWFINIGGYLRNLETAFINASRFKRGYVTYTQRQHMFTDGSYYFHSGTRTVSREAKSKSTMWGKERQVLLSFPFPSFPKFNANLGSGRLLNAAALLSQLLHGK